MTEKQLISKLQTLKQIKPKQDWVVLVKNQILGNKAYDKSKVGVNYIDRLPVIFRALFSQRKLAYSIAVFLFIIAGLTGVVINMLPDDSVDVNVAQQTPASLSTAVKSEVEALKVKSQNLVDVAKNKPQDFSLAVKEVKDAANTLTQAVEKDPELAKEIALEVINNKTLLSVVSEAEVEEASNNLYKTIVEQIIKDFEATTLTEEEQAIFDEVKDLYEQGEYAKALEEILLIN